MYFSSMVDRLYKIKFYVKIEKMTNNVQIFYSTMADNTVGFQDIEHFWSLFVGLSDKSFVRYAKHFFTEYGTSRPCNRFDIGVCIEYALTEMLRTNDTFVVEEMSDAKRYDICIEGHGCISIKYSSKGNIRLHNSMGENTDVSIKDTFIITPKEIILLHCATIKDMGIDIDTYIINNTEALILKRSLLTVLRENQYKYIRKIDIECDKKKCLNKSCAWVVFQDAKRRLGILSQQVSVQVQVPELEPAPAHELTKDPELRLPITGVIDSIATLALH
jgi:hypothetical protein